MFQIAPSLVFFSQYALEVIFSLSHSLTVLTNFTDVTLVSEDTY